MHRASLWNFFPGCTQQRAESKVTMVSLPFIMAPFCSCAHSACGTKPDHGLLAAGHGTVPVRVPTAPWGISMTTTSFAVVATRLSLCCTVFPSWWQCRFQGCDHWLRTGSDLCLESAARVYRLQRRPVLFLIVQDRRACCFVSLEA